MRLLLVDTVAVRSGERAKAAALAACGHAVTLLAPLRFRENYALLRARRPRSAAYRLVLGRVEGKPPNRCLFFSGLRQAFDPAPEAVLVMADENFWLTWQMLRAARLLAPRALFLCHSWQNLDFDRRRFPQPTRLLYEWDTALERGVFARAAAIMVRNREAAGVLRRRGYAGRLAYIPWGVDAHRFTPGPAAGARPYTVGFVGRLVADKGVLDLLAASRLMTAGHRLLIVGGGPLEGAVEAEARARPGVVERVPVADHRDMPDLYRRMDVLALPSRTGRAWKEQFGRVLAEAMCCRVAVAGSNSGAIPEVIGGAGRVFTEGDPGHMARVLDELADPSVRGPLAAAGERRARERFSWATWAARTDRLLSDLAAESRPGVNGMTR